MRERKQILKLWRQLAAEGKGAVLATVVRTEGSSYRLPGARLLLAEDGRRAGGVSGGCLEDDIIKRAWWRTAAAPILRRYDTTADGEISTEGYGLGCNGIIHVLLQRLAPRQSPLMELLHSVASSRRPATFAHLTSPEALVGRWMAFDSHGDISTDLNEPQLMEALRTRLTHLEASSVEEVTPGVRAFLELLTPPIHLMIFGAGDDAVALTEMGYLLGWQISVLDGRAHYARRDKFPLAGAVVVRAPESPVSNVDAWTAAVVMTHSYSQDLDVLTTLAGSRLRYLGVLGPRQRTAQLISEIGSRCRILVPEVYTPMGLDLGGDGPQQIALAVAAEIQSVFQGGGGGALRDRSGPIHAQASDQSDTAWVRSIVCA